MLQHFFPKRRPSGCIKDRSATTCVRVTCECGFGKNIPDPVPDPVPDPIPDPGQSSGGGFPNGGQEDGRVGQHLWCSGSRHAFQASDPGSNPGRRNFCQFCGAYPGPRLLSRHHIS